jgi:catechol 2,3-dioxygenase-like lactoylglutathione lyase family enzyme
MIQGKHYQNAYVTRDMEQSLAFFRDQCGAENASSFEVEVDVWTPSGSGKVRNRLAFIWIDNLQYELIQPVSGLVDIYTNAIPNDEHMQFHHICMRVPAWRAFRDRVDDRGYKVVLEGGDENLRYLYLDARDTVGHYLEYTCMTDERWLQLGGKL